jgi:hypothetical protein
MTATTGAGLLPEGFEDFEPFLDWALPKQSERAAKKMTCTFEEIKALYDFGLRDDNIARGLEYCDRYPLDALPPEASRLLWILFSVAEVRPQVEAYGQVHQPFPGEEVLPHRMSLTPECDVL